MNPSGTFGSSQGGAFQTPGGTMKTSLFGQAFGQHSPNNQGLFQPPAFGQQSVMNQAAGHGTPIFGQTPVFGLPQPLSTVSPAPTFGQQPLGSFGSSSGSSFGQTNVSSQSSVVGQGAGFGQPPAFGVTSGFGKQPAFGGVQMAGSNPALGQPQGLGFGQTSFGQTPSSTSSSTSLFGQTQTIAQSRGFGSSEFSFKPANDAVFKPIFSASPEPANPQTTPATGSPLSASGSQESSSTNPGFSFLTGPKVGPAGFGLPQKTPASSSSSSLTTAGGSDQTITLPFSFHQPPPPSIPSTTASTKEPTTPSSFSFSLKDFQTQPTPLSVGAGLDQPSAFGDPKAKVETSLDKNESIFSEQGNSNIFREFGRGTKRPTVESPRQQSKRPLIRSRGQPGGLLGRALNAIRKDQSSSARNEAPKETPQQTVTWVETERRAAQPQEEDLPAPSSLQMPTRDVQEPTEESISLVKTPEPKVNVSTPVSRGERSESLDSLGGMSPSELTSILCRNIPPALNKRNVIEKHFARFGKVCKILCRPGKNLAIVHFNDHVEAAKAKKRGKIFHKRELTILWIKKKHSPENKGGQPPEEKEEESPQMESKSASSPRKTPHLRPPALSSSLALSHSSPVRRASPAKVLQFDPEPQKEIKTESQSSERPVPSSLLHLIGQVAETAEEKFRLLEQRDKILRQGRSKQTDLELAFVGTCPDMCPEKERYMRETRNQLSVFEVIPNTEMVNHTAAIKEYSRSSADQEEPLPHELRPLPVLKMTMDYLVTQIMDLGQDNYRDWYDFVWNRTRSIRKDITQQQLCCPETVSLIEKCTRFHVHCAHHFCEEPISFFDPKINTENMTKCLQSLKEMYEDLATHQTFCPSEAEFRQYSVLLKLNHGDILREVQQFRDEVRNSPEVKFAVQVFAAVNSNNFVHFFKLVKGASYLAGCLLHRYFNQVRTKALKVLNIAYTVGTRSTPLPLEDLTRMLMFRNPAEATDFVQQFGLNVTEGMVELSRVVYQEPDIPLSPKRSDVITAKKTVLNGEVVNGGPLPNPPHHTPRSSFDFQNKYQGEPATSNFIKVTKDFAAPPSTHFEASASFPSVSSETGEPGGSHNPPAQLTEPQQPFPFISKPEPVKPPSPPPVPQQMYSDEDILTELDCVIDEVVKAEVKEVTDEGAAYITAALQESGVQVECVVSEVIQRMLQEISSTEIKLEQERVAEENRRLEEARRRQEREAFLAQFSSSLCTEIIHEVLDETIQETASSEIQEAVNEKAERLAKCTEQICNSLVEETLNTDIAMLVEDLLEAELQRIYKYIKRWRAVVTVRRQLKRQMRGFPAAPCCVDPCFKLKALAPSAPTQPRLADLARGMVNLGNAGSLTVSSTRLLEMRQGATHQMRVHYYFQQLLEKHSWAPLDLVSLVTENIPDAHDRIFWKALLLLPSDHESAASVANRVLSDWLEAKLGGEQQSEEHLDGSLWTLSVTNALQESGKLTHKVQIAVKASRGPLTANSLSRVERCSELQGTGALILLLPTLPVFEPGLQDQGVPDSLLSALLQLRQLQQVNTWHCPLPLVILVPGPDGGAAYINKLQQALRLNTLMEEGLISKFTFFFIPETTNDLQGSKQLSQALCWLLARAPPPLPLSCQTLVHLIETSLSREFEPRVYANRQERAAAHLPPQDPVHAIRLYNSILDHVADTVASESLCRLSWPPGEFSVPHARRFVPHLAWNSLEHLAWLRNAILSLQLPEWEPLPPTGSWSEICSFIFRYAAKIPASHLSQPLLMSRLENLLERVRLKTHPTQTPGFRGNTDYNSREQSPSIGQIPWDDVVVMCIDHKLKDWHGPEEPVCEDALTEDGDILVYFSAESLKDFQAPEEWTEAVRQTHEEKKQEKDWLSTVACATSDTFSLQQKLFHTQLDADEASATPLDITHVPTAQERKVHKFLQSLEEEKAESKRFTEKLQFWLNGEPLEHLSTPLFIPSSTLLSMPHTIKQGSSDRTGVSPLAQRHDEAPDKAELKKTTPTSMSWKLQDLERQILLAHEEEVSCSLKLSELFSIVDD
ncbi:Germinal-center associated nuclear protein [Oryzias melastigma]|uniref:Germinal-center associated nuclear protein n=1 Tax=Oryzias melastigma TaxID=30732 RepID=A0A834L1X0_ORYME|nr:Germinal-center associated nuclear protein [Oryzias melastigma]